MNAVSLALVLGAAAALSACSLFETNEQKVENAIRAQLAQQGEVKQVEMTQDGDRMTGFAVLRPTGADADVRSNCTAQREGEMFNFECSADPAQAAAPAAQPAASTAGAEAPAAGGKPTGDAAPAAEGGKPGVDEAPVGEVYEGGFEEEVDGGGK
jgi:hypothetical protein